MKLQRVEVRPESLERFAAHVDAKQLERASRALAQAREQLAGRVVWNVNSTAVGGGVAEMLGPLLSYARGADVDARWLVIEGSPEFFKITSAFTTVCTGRKAMGYRSDPRSVGCTRRRCATTPSSSKPTCAPTMSCCCTTRRRRGLLRT